jgi:hypothetical protein
MICDIAAAHGGDIEGDADTIRRLRYKPTKKPILRPHLLAAILRFADEISEDYTRAPRFVQEQDILTKSSEVYHSYAHSLREVKVVDGIVELRFAITRQDVSSRLLKNSQNL